MKNGGFFFGLKKSNVQFSLILDYEIMFTFFSEKSYWEKLKKISPLEIYKSQYQDITQYVLNVFKITRRYCEKCKLNIH